MLCCTKGTKMTAPTQEPQTRIELYIGIGIWLSAGSCKALGGLSHGPHILDCLSEVLFWSTLGCMTAQTYAEVQFREQAASAVVYQPMPADSDYGSYEAPKAPSAPPATE